MKDLSTIWGLMAGYWRSERWLEAWLLTAIVLALTTLLSKASVWAALASGNFISALAGYQDAGGTSAPVKALGITTLIFFSVHVGRAGGVALRHLLSATLHRRARAWLVDRFNAALLEDERIAFDLMSDRDRRPTQRRGLRLPDAIDQRVDDCSIGLYGGLIGLAMGLWGALASIWFVSKALIERSTVVPMLDEWILSATATLGGILDSEAIASADVSPGRYGSALLAGVLVAFYVPALTFLAWLIGRVIERLQIERQRRDGAWRGELNTMLGRVAEMAASRGERAQKRINERLYTDIDRIWHVQNIWNSGLMMFTDVYNFLSHRLLAYLPALPAYLSGNMTFRDFASNSELTAELIGDISWLINVMPAIAMLRANARRLSELAAAIEKVGAREAFYGETGISEFHRVQDPDLRGLRLRDLELRHRGLAARPFLRVPTFRLDPGDWASVIGPSGCGKSALFRAIDGLWPYGRGTITMGSDDRLLFASQQPDIPERMTLKSLTAYPEPEEDFDDAIVSDLLVTVGLGDFVPELHAELHTGLGWRRVLSGGQQERLVFSRILLHRPSILLLDEATAALDPAASLSMYRLLKRSLPETAVLSVHHAEFPPVWPDGTPMYDTILEIADGVARQRPAKRRLVQVPQ
jgi:putative ATP-binding cassette transporter